QSTCVDKDLYSLPPRRSADLAGEDGRGAPVPHWHRLQRRRAARPTRAGSHRYLSVLGIHLHRTAALRPLSAHTRRSVTEASPEQDRKSTRLNSSHVKTSYAVF